MANIPQRLESIKQVIVVLSGKGGVGKSTVAVQLALCLYGTSPRTRVGILDTDLTIGRDHERADVFRKIEAIGGLLEIKVGSLEGLHQSAIPWIN